MITHNSLETFDFAKKIAKNAKPSNIYCLIGDLAAGKTVFTKGFINYFSKDLVVVSPTFTVFKIYEINKNNIERIYHFDLYRLKTIEELEDIGFFEYINDENSISIIEWGDIFIDFLPKKTKIFKFKKINDDEREIDEYFGN